MAMGVTLATLAELRNFQAYLFDRAIGEFGKLSSFAIVGMKSVKAGL
jgi:hypothetical protein